MCIIDDWGLKWYNEIENLRNKEVNMKKVKRYDFIKKPQSPNRFLMWLAKRFACDKYIREFGCECEKINMEGIKPPYFLLANHASEMDFRVLFEAIAPYNMNFVVAIDAVHDIGITLMHKVGGITKRKFIPDYVLIKNMRHCIKHHKVPLCIYPEARYTFDGTTSYITPAVGKMCKLLKVPVVVLIAEGNYITNPQWNKDNFRKTPLRGTLKCIANQEEVETLSADEINKRISENFVYDDFQYQLDNKISIDFPERARGLNRILYQCCECGTEGEMYSGGTVLECRACGKKWEMSEYGQLKCLNGETRFPHIPHWFKWERENVKREVLSGEYYFEDEVDVYTLPKNKYYPQGVGKVVQDMNGTHIYCNEYGKPLEWHLAPSELESVHIEFNYTDKKSKTFFGDCLDISKTDDSFWLHPKNKRDVIMKISLATEELHFKELQRIRNEQLAAEELAIAEQIALKELAEKMSKKSNKRGLSAPNKSEKA